MKRIALSILAAGVAAAVSAQTSAPAPATAGSAPAGVAIIDAQRLALESAPGKEA